jgi:hypothetical protein
VKTCLNPENRCYTKPSNSENQHSKQKAMVSGFEADTGLTKAETPLSDCEGILEANCS